MAYAAKFIQECNLTLQQVKEINKHNIILEKLLREVTGNEVYYSHRHKLKKGVAHRGCEISICEPVTQRNLHIIPLMMHIETELRSYSFEEILHRARECRTMNMENYQTPETIYPIRPNTQSAAIAFYDDLISRMEKYLLSQKLQDELRVANDIKPKKSKI